MPRYETHPSFREGFCYTQLYVRDEEKKTLKILGKGNHDYQRIDCFVIFIYRILIFY